MKIHTTQDLNSLAGAKSINKLSSNEIRSNYSEIMFRKSLMEEPDSYENSISFKGNPTNNAKDIIPKLAKRIKDTTSKRASDKKNIKEGILSSDRFNRMLHSILSNEVISNAGIAFLIGWLFRVPTILSLPEWLGGKHKEDKAMAAAHSGASVTMGVITAVLLTLPINKAAKYARESLYHKIKPELLEKRHPQLDLDSIKDSTGKLLEVKNWKDKAGNVFDTNIKTPMTVARPKFCGDIAEATFKSMGINIDMTANKGKSAQEMTLRDGRKLIDVLKPKDMFIAIEEEGMGTTVKGLKDTNFFSLEYIDKDYLSKTIPDLDINTAFVDGKVTHPNQWRTKNNKHIKDLDIYISNYLETAESTPIYTGVKRDEGGIQKYVAYQNNGNGGLGTAITTDMINADRNIDTTNKVVGWAIEILTRVPVGLCTVAMIPRILDMFTLFGNKKHVADTKEADIKQQNNLQEENNNIQEITEEGNVAEKTEKETGNISFKGNKPNKVTKWIGEHYVLEMLNSTKLQSFVEEFTSKFKMSMTEAMTILGSFFMSSSYVFGTLTNKKFEDKDRRNTLAINQTLGFVVPTFLGAWISGKIRPMVKKVTYQFVGQQTQRIKLAVQNGKLSKEAEAKALEGVAKAAKGIPVLASLTVFTFIYRYFTPVAVTPVANFFGNKLSDIKNKKNSELEEQKTIIVEMKPENNETANEVDINEKTKQYKTVA